MAHADYVIAGAGVIGLSLALELWLQGSSVTVLDAGKALQQSSFAAAGMLAVQDPANPIELAELARLSASLYPAFLDRLANLTGLRIPFQTCSTLQTSTRLQATSTLHARSLNVLRDPRQVVPQLGPAPPSFELLEEHSVDPRQLAQVLLAAIRNTSIDLREDTALTRVAITASSVRVDTTSTSLAADFFIDCMGAWSPAPGSSSSPIMPRKGQMLAVRMPSGFDLDAVVRSEDVYIVPRTQGPNAGRALIGATIEDAGFDRTVHPQDLLALNARAVRLLPGLAEAEFLEAWAGLRPATSDGLPLLGATRAQPRYLLATGHFRNGILLAPATARLLSQLLSGHIPEIDLAPFAPDRFATTTAVPLHPRNDIRTSQ